MENLDQNNKNVSLSLIAEYGASDSESDDTEAPSIENMIEDSEENLMSEMVLKNNIINACAHGPLAAGVREDAETSRHMIIDSSESGVVEYEVTEYRDADDSDSDSSISSDSDSDVDSVKDVEELSSSDENEETNVVEEVVEKVEIPKVPGELGLDDLPPIEDLAISLPSQETTKIGTIASIVDRLVIVRALPETPAVDLDSVLFLENGAKTLGKVFDVFGPVTEPHYCVRFNSAEHVRERGAAPGADVFIAPQDRRHTTYVFLNELMKIKGTDASWLHDVEPPPSQQEYSDDEEERRANRQRRQAKNQEEEPEEERRKERRNQRPSESSSRFGSGPSRGRNPFSAGSRRNPSFNSPRYSRPWPQPPPQEPFPFTAPPGFPMFPPPFNPAAPPPFMNQFQFGQGPRMQGQIPPIRPSGPVFGGAYCPGPPQWANGPPPPPGT